MGRLVRLFVAVAAVASYFRDGECLAPRPRALFSLGEQSSLGSYVQKDAGPDLEEELGGDDETTPAPIVTMTTVTTVSWDEDLAPPTFGEDTSTEEKVTKLEAEKTRLLQLLRDAEEDREYHRRLAEASTKDYKRLADIRIHGRYEDEVRSFLMMAQRLDNESKAQLVTAKARASRVKKRLEEVNSELGALKGGDGGDEEEET